MNALLKSGDPRRRKLLRWGSAATVGGFVFGYELAVISGALLSIRRDFDLSAFEQGALVGILPLGAMVGGLLAGRLADGLGRRRTLLIDAVVFMAGALTAVIAPSYGVLLLARAVTGVAVGAASSTVPLYLSEISPASTRGRLVSFNQLMVTVGIVAAYCVNLAFASAGDWRAMFAVGLLPAAALLVSMARAPETPAWLHAHGRADEAEQIVRAVADGDEAESMLAGFRDSLREQGAGARLRDVLTVSARPALVVGLTLAVLQQFSGINAVIYYAPSIMEQTGLSASNSILYSVIVGLVNVAATVIAIRFVDRAGRRPLLIASLAGMSASLALLGLTFTLPFGSAESWLALLCLLGYIAAFAIGLGPIFWLLIAEIFPPRARATGASVATATNWFTNFAIGLAFLPVAAAIGEAATFWIFAGVCAVAIAFVSRYVPETKGRSFAEIQSDVRHRWHGVPAEGAAAY